VTGLAPVFDEGIKLARSERTDRGARRFRAELQLLIEGLALKRPPPAITTIHLDVTAVAKEHGWPVPSYATLHDVVRHLDPALAVLAREGTRRYQELYDLVYLHRGQGRHYSPVKSAAVVPGGRTSRSSSRYVSGNSRHPGAHAGSRGIELRSDSR
jgi:hypothetical protein